ncbi:MAG: Uncharacterised protein [Cryomorphaceae bacterium]|nr:MAG: Uncharacterised protein [Cryomorphaceae bacterium]
MKGNIFICLNRATYKGLIPKELEGKYARKVYDEEGEFVKLLPTTFEEVASDNRIKFGSVIQFKIGTRKYFVIELDCSWLGGEVSTLLDLGSKLNYPNNCLMTNSEAMELINSNKPKEEPL